MRQILFSLFCCFLLLSCGNTPCGRAELDFRLIGFSAAESDTMIIRRLKRNSPDILGSVEYNPSNPVRFEQISDTSVMVMYSSDILLRSNFDYLIIFPAASRTFHITDINEAISYKKNHGLFSTTKEYCINAITGCKIDGSPVSIIQFPNTIYLRK